MGVEDLRHPGGSTRCFAELSCVYAHRLTPLMMSHWKGRQCTSVILGAPALVYPHLAFTPSAKKGVVLSVEVA